MHTDPASEHVADEKQLEQCHSYLFSQLRAREVASLIHGPPPSGPAITISFQTGSGEHEIATLLAKILQALEPKGAVPWTVFYRNLVERMLEEHHLPQSLAKLLPEERRSCLADVRDELIGLRPPSWVVVPQITETVLHLADAGHAILMGWGANIITARLPNMFHVRLVASLPQRIAQVRKQNNLTPGEAAEFVAKSDRGRERYLKSHFHASAEDDLLYHLVVNTDRLPPQSAAQLIADGALGVFKKCADGDKQGEAGKAAN